MIDAANELKLLLNSRHALIVIESVEPERTLSLLRYATNGTDHVILEWDRLRGLQRVGGTGGVYGTEEPLQALSHVASSTMKTVYHLPGISAQLTDPVSNAAFRDAVMKAKAAGRACVLTGASVDLDPALQALATHFTMPLPDERELSDLLRHVIRDMSLRQHVEISLSKAETARLLSSLSGLTLMEAEKILTKAIVEDGRLTVEDIEHVVAAKREVVEREGLLEYYPLEESLTEVADLVRLKQWLSKRAAVIRDPDAAREFGLEFPRGILLLGVPGCGKSLSAKAVAREWQLPLLRLDPSNLYNKYVGESERNFKRAVLAAERMAPVILWVDELEKAFASGGDDGGVSTRVLGGFLSWMQDRRGDVFVVATANQIDQVPPELLRKGRFDEIFFVDLPHEPTRGEIFAIHLRNRKKDPGQFDLAALAASCPGFSGAEIEQVVVSALFTVFSAGGQLDTGVLLREVAATVPLSQTMAERIDRMRQWARNRAVPAN